MSKFTERLWRELVREHGADSGAVEPAGGQARAVVEAATGVRQHRRGRRGGNHPRRRPRRGDSPPAFAVTRNDDGTVTVKVMR